MVEQNLMQCLEAQGGGSMVFCCGEDIALNEDGNRCHRV